MDGGDRQSQEEDDSISRERFTFTQCVENMHTSAHILTVPLVGVGTVPRLERVRGQRSND